MPAQTADSAGESLIWFRIVRAAASESGCPSTSATSSLVGSGSPACRGTSGRFFVHEARIRRRAAAALILEELRSHRHFRLLAKLGDVAVEELGSLHFEKL